jgi:hypothetical protein
MKRAARPVAWAGLLVLLAAYAYLAFRQDSSFFTVPWMPREMARQILSVTNYRNFWGFGFLGLYAALFLGAWWWVRRGGRWQWGTILVLLVPLLKEALQSPIPGRHGTAIGAFYGLTGAAVGLLLGSGLRAGTSAMWKRLKGAWSSPGMSNRLRAPGDGDA